MDRAARSWALRLARCHPDVLRIGYFGSYARGDWGVGSDLDLLVIVKTDPRPFHERSREWDTTDLPVPVDVLVYTEEEWNDPAGTKLFHRTAEAEAVWIYTR